LCNEGVSFRLILPCLLFGIGFLIIFRPGNNVVGTNDRRFGTQAPSVLFDQFKFVLPVMVFMAMNKNFVKKIRE
jgi:hypothetical protein